MAISITMMCGRFGAVAGNLLFPVLFNAGCLGPFVMIGIACLSKFTILQLVVSKSTFIFRPFHYLFILLYGLFKNIDRYLTLER